VIEAVEDVEVIKGRRLWSPRRRGRPRSPLSRWHRFTEAVNFIGLW